MFKKIVVVLIIVNISLYANSLKIAVGAGYKQPIMSVIKEYEKNEKKIEAIFGNMKQITAQASQANIALVIGDKTYLDKKSAFGIFAFKKKA